MRFSAHLGDRTSDMLLNQLMSQSYRIEEKYQKMTKKQVKRLKTKQVKKSQTEEGKKTNQDFEDMKSHNANEERRRQFEKVEEISKQEEKARQREVSRLKEAIILSEIIGQPRCRSRQNRRIRRG